MSAFEPYLDALGSGDATVLYARAGAEPAWRVDGEIVHGGDRLPAGEEFDELLRDLAAAAGMLGGLRDATEVEFGHDHGDRRYRIQIFRAREGRTAVIREVPVAVPAPVDLRLSSRLQEAVAAGTGLVLVGGPRRSGRTTAVASLLQSVGDAVGRYIVSLERPVEFRVRTRRALVHQLRVGTDTPDFAAGMRAALASGADMIAVGAVEDGETARLVVDAIDRGIGVLAVVTARDVAAGLQRLFDLLPEGERGLLRTCVAQNLELAFHQYLLDGVLPVSEWLAATPETVAALRAGDTQHVRALLASRQTKGVQAHDESIAALVHQGALTRERALLLARNRTGLEQRLAR